MGEDGPPPLPLSLSPPVSRELGRDTKCPAVLFPTITVFLMNRTLIAGEEKIKRELIEALHKAYALVRVWFGRWEDWRF